MPGAEPQTAEFELDIPLLRLRFRLRLTPLGLWAIGGLASGVLLSSAALVWSGTPGRR